MLIPPYRIALSGGGIKGFAHVGALEVLQERGYLKAVKEYIGISAGALCAMCICIGCSLSELRMMVSLLDFSQVRDIDPETILNFPETFGVDTGANLEKLLVAILRARKLNPQCTFAELAALGLGPNLRIIATNMNTCLAHEFSAARTPAASVLFAVRASMSVPIYFTPLKEPVSGHVFLDGGIMCPSPFRYLTYEEQLHTLAISFGDSHKPISSINTLQEFIFQLYYSFDYKHAVELKQKWKHNTLVIECGRVNSIDFETGQETKHAIMEAGRRGADDFLKSPGPTPVRRFSMP